jgi:hypothetical protein
MAGFVNPLAVPAPRDGDSDVLTLLRRAVNLTATRQDSRPARVLFADLTSRGPAAWREAAVILTRLIVAMSPLRPGQLLPGEYQARQDPADAGRADMVLVDAATVAYLTDADPAAAAAVFAGADPVDVAGAVRLLFCAVMDDQMTPGAYQQLVADLLAAAA